MKVVEAALLRHLVADHLLRHVLEIQVEAGVDAIAPLIAGIDAVFLGERLQDIVDEVGRLEFGDRREDL